MSGNKRQEREELILELFVQYYFGHLRPLFQPWKELEQLVIRHCEGGKIPPQETFKDLQEKLYESVQAHTSSRFLVPSRFKKEIGNWIKKIGIEQNWHNLQTDFKAWTELDEDEKASEYIFKTYDYGDKKVVLLEENRDPLGHGTTGLVSWQGAALLTSWVENFGFEFVENQHVLELGSGLGLLGLSLLKGQGHGGIKSFTFTDCHPQVLNFLRINVGLNFGQETHDFEDWLNKPPCAKETNEKDSVASLRDCEVFVKSLDWTSYDEEQIPTNLGLVLGSDLVYSSALLPGLCRLIRVLLVKNKANDCKAIIASTQRSLEHQEEFLNLLKGEDLETELVLKRTFSPDENIMINHEPMKPVCVHRITLK